MIESSFETLVVFKPNWHWLRWHFTWGHLSYVTQVLLETQKAFYNCLTHAVVFLKNRLRCVKSMEFPWSKSGNADTCTVSLFFTFNQTRLIIQQIEGPIYGLFLCQLRQEDVRVAACTWCYPKFFEGLWKSLWSLPPSTKLTMYQCCYKVFLWNVLSFKPIPECSKASLKSQWKRVFHNV